MTKTAFFFLFLFSALLPAAGCAGPRAAAAPEPGQVTLSAEARAKMERKAEQETKARQELFDSFSAKMDEYQDLLVACEALSDKEEDRPLKTACTERLKTLRRELADLGALLEESPEAPQ